MNTANKKSAAGRGSLRAGRIIVPIVLVLIFAALLFVIYMNSELDLFGTKKSKNTEKITYTVEFASVEPSVANKLMQGVIVRDVNGTALGSVSSLETDEPAVIYFTENAPFAIAQGHPTNIKVIANIEVIASSDPTLGYSVNGTRIAVGAEYELSLSEVTLTGKCIGLQTEQDNGGIGK